jgi:hypothetical protein
MIVNGINFKTYLFDTLESVKERVCVQFFPDVLNKFINFVPKEFSISDPATEIQAINLIAPFLNLSGDFPNQLFHRSFSNQEEIKREEVEKMFVLYYKDVQNIKSATGAQEEFIFAVLNQINGLSSIDAIQVWKKRNDVKTKIAREIKLLKEKVIQFEKEAREFERIQSVEVSDFNQTRVDINMTFKIPKPFITLENFFDNAKVSKYTPFIMMKSGGEDPFYKILNNFSPSDEWITLILDNVILFKIDHETQSTKLRKYSNASLAVSEDREPNTTTVFVSINVPIFEQNNSKETFIKRFFEAVPLLSFENMVSEKEAFITGLFYVPHHCNPIIWSDLAMNNKFFYNIFILNEIMIPSRIRILFMYVLVSVRINGNKNVLNSKNYDTISLISKKYLKGPAPTNFKTFNGCYTRFRIQCQTMNDVARYKAIIGRFFTIYLNEKDTLAQQYSFYISTFSLQEEGCDISEEKGLREIVPDLFVSSYSRKCLKPPKIASDQEAEQLVRKGKTIMRYPLFGEGVEHNYYCDFENYPFPGLRVNTLPNKNKYSFIPCCYTVDQSKKKNSKLNQYIKSNSQTRRFTDSILDESDVKLLPDGLKQFFSLISSDPETCFVILQLPEHNLSLIEAVMSAMKMEKDGEGIRKDQVVREHLRLLKKPNIIMASQQELYDKTNEEILTMMRTENMVPSLFIHMMEEAYNINIFLFSTENNPRGEMIIPRHTSLYYKAKPTRKTIMLLQTERGYCSLIFQTNLNIPSQITTMFAPESSLVKSLWVIFSRLSQSFVQDKVIAPLIIPEYFRTDVVAQWIDYFGKCRIVLLKNNLLLMTDPLPPFAAPLITKINRETNPATLINYINNRKLRIIEQREKTGKICEISVMMENTNIIFLVDFNFPVKNIPLVKNTEEYQDIFKSIFNLDQFNYNKKIAYVLSQYAIFLFSEFLHLNKTTNIDEAVNDINIREQIIRKFSEKFIIDPRYKYVMMDNSIFDKNSQFVKNGKLVVTSEEMKRRLLYIVHSYWMSHQNEIKDYHTMTNIPNFFESVVDFSSLPNAVVLKGETAVTNLFATGMKKQVLKTIQPELTQPYFFYSEIIDPADQDPRLFLAVNCNKLIDGINFIKLWNNYNYKYIQTFEGIVDEKDNVAVYSYVNEKDIVMIQTPTDVPILPGAILGYIYKDQKMYTALLPL